MAFWVTLAVYGAVWTVQKLYAHYAPQKKPPLRRLDAEPENFTVKAGTPLPMFWGRVFIAAPNVVWASPQVHMDSDPSGCETWAQNLLFILGIPGRGRGAGGDKIRLSKMFVNGQDLRISVLEHEDAYILNRPYFHGGEGEGGSIHGDINFEGGRQDNTSLGVDEFAVWQPGVLSAAARLKTAEANKLRLAVVGGAPYAAAVAEYDAAFSAYIAAVVAVANTWPAYRLQTKVLLRNIRDLSRRGFQYGESQTLPTFAFEVHNPCDLDFGGSPAKVFSMVDTGDANPVSIIWDVLTGPFGRVGLAESTIDLANFSAVAQVLSDERHGCSLLITEPQSAEEIIRTVLTQINGVLYVEPTTGLFTLKLIRPDYVVGSTPVLDQTNVIEFQLFATTTPAGAYNQVRITYTDGRTGTQREVSAIDMDLANIMSFNNRVRPIVAHYPGVHTATIAGLIAARTLAETSVPLSMVRLRCQRFPAANLRPGSPFRLSWPDRGIVAQVFRVQGIDLGGPEDDSITIDAIRDVFDITAPIIDVDVPIPAPEPLVLPIQTQLVTEAPRWFLRQAALESLIADEDAPHGFYLAVSAQDGSPAFSAEVRTPDGVRTTHDASLVDYPKYIVLDSEYLYNWNPYDTTTGLEITLGLNTAASDLFSGVAAGQINDRGRNLIYLGSEIIAYETVVDLGGGVYRLEDVWRGLLDTAPVTHAPGEVGYLLADAYGFTGTPYCGRRLRFADFDVLEGRLLPKVGSRFIDPEAAGVEPVIYDPPRGRTVLPFVPADVRVNNAKAFSFATEGIEVTWRRRRRDNNIIVRGDAASETITQNWNYITVGQRMPTHLPADAEVELSSTHASATPTSGFGSMAVLGYGPVDLGVRTHDIDNDLDSWDTSKVRVIANHWRNLLLNPTFADGLTVGWSTAATTDVSFNDGVHLAEDYGYIHADFTDGDEPDITLTQTVAIDGWRAEKMVAVLNYHGRQIEPDDDPDDDITATLEVFDDENNLLDSVTETWSPVDRWDHRAISVVVPAGGVTLKVTFELTANDEPPTIPNTAITNPILRLGQIGSELAANGSFTTGDTTSWTVGAGSFTVETLLPFSSAHYIRAGSTNPSELYQDVTIPAGYQYGCVAVLRCGRKHDVTDAAEFGEVRLDARDGGGTVVASTTTGAETLTSGQGWVLRELVLDNIPPTATVVRIRAIASRTSGSGTINACFDDFAIRFHKHLDPDLREEVDFTTPVAQPLPLDLTEFPVVFPLVPMPTYGGWGGTDMVGQRGIEPDMAAPDGLRLGRFVGAYDARRGTMSSSCFEFETGDDGIVSYADQFGYGAFRTQDSWTAVAFIRVRARAAAACGILGRQNASAGWALRLDSSGRAQANVLGDSATMLATNSTALNDGAIHLVAMTYDGTTNTLTVIDEGQSTSVTNTGVGNIRPPEAVAFRLGRAAETDICLPGQIGRVWLWREVLPVATIQSMHRLRNAVPSALTVNSYARTGAAVTSVGSDANGVMLASAAENQVPMRFYGQDVDGSDLYQMVATGGITNLAPGTDLTDTSGYVRESGVTATIGALAPLGFLDALTLVGNNTQALRTTVTVGAGNIRVWWYARVAAGTASMTARVALDNSAGTNKGNHDYTVTNVWQRFSHTFTTWDASTATARIRFLASASGSTQTIIVAMPIVVSQAHTVDTFALPYSTSVSDSSLTLVTTVSAQFNHEGTMHVELQAPDSAGLSSGTVVKVSNGTNNNDARELVHPIVFKHYDGSGTNVDSDPAEPSWGDPMYASCRWNRAELLDDEGSSQFAGIRLLGSVTTAYGRTTTFTASTTALTRLFIGPSRGAIFRVILTAREVNKTVFP